ncbi:MAG: 30S ribosomal protein S12 methylthiotransferase RimO [Bacteroidales bacterium]|nr:30S ribosomal protein S12 methylthiotransferase RimO [Bacteroidales bacterium]HOY39473.1 30S ribosomal protein S12 methylthiotransferase RimO [Bacteroidales bacterium]HQP04667.1 30S ribosomal protein S12 methylthiotransferase RimO [Bacteroidales bacterium]
MKQIPKKIAIISLGCSKNLVDSEQLHFHLQQSGYAVQHNPEKVNAEIVVVNTCGFINDAKEESIDTILGLAEAKKQGNIKKLVVFGCLPQRYMAELKKEIPEVDVFQGNYNLNSLLSEITGISSQHPWFYRSLENPGHYAYLKIAEGCNRKCSFCAIPGIKGKYVSRSIDSIVEEASYLAGGGVKEMLLIAQDTGYYGYDHSKRFMLSTLLNELVPINGIEWIRLHYLYPGTITRELSLLIKNNDKICRYIDIPVQHISDAVLKRMQRNTKRADIEKAISYLRELIPDIAIRTTLLVGYPGETEKDFDELCRFVESTEFDRLGAFSYSHEENTWGGMHHSDDIPEHIKQQRLETIMSIQQAISLKKNQQKVGKTMKVIFDRKENGQYIGRSEYDSPEIDNEVIVESSRSLVIGNFYQVEITGAGDYEVFGKISK